LLAGGQGCGGHRALVMAGVTGQRVVVQWTGPGWLPEAGRRAAIAGSLLAGDDLAGQVVSGIAAAA